jgi:hypothetical protein
MEIQMKKVVFALLMCAAGLAHAGGTIILGTGTQDNNTGANAGTSSSLYNIKVIGDITRQWDADINMINTRNDSTNSIMSQYEVGLRYKEPLSKNLVVYLRGTTGVIQVSGRSSDTYAGVEPGVIWRVAGGPVTTKVDYTWATGVNNNNLDIGMTRVQLGYDISKENTISLRRDWMRGDINFDAWIVGIAHKF